MNSRIFRVMAMLLRMNWPLSLAVAGLCAVGAVFVYGASSLNEDAVLPLLFRKHIVFLALGAAAYAGFAALDYRLLRRWSWWIYAAVLVLLVLTLAFGRRMYGAQRWLTLPGVSALGLQPSELAKLGVVLLIARRLSRPDGGMYHGGALASAAVIAAVPMLLILKQPDLGTAVMLPPVLLAMMFAAGLPWRALGTIAAVAVVGLSVVTGALLLPERFGRDEAAQERIAGYVGLSPYQRDRILVFFRPDRDPLGAGWNKMQSEIAVGSGAFWGKGYRRGTQNVLGFLPRSVAPTDFIFSVIAEETGFAGSAALLALYAVAWAAGLQAALAARDRMGRLICVGVTSVLFCHMFVNIAMTVGLMPITGLPLPLISYGGTFLVVTMSSLGIVQSVWIRSRERGVIYEQGRLWG